MSTPWRVSRLAAAAVVLLSQAVTGLAATPQTVYFPGGDGKVELVGYLYLPAGGARHPAVVLLHGRAGPYSSNVNASCTRVLRGEASPCNAKTLSRRHQMWGEYWADRGYVALLVDSFGPRGRGHGYGRGTHDDPDRDEVNELTVRPLDAEAALAYLVTRPDVRPARVMLQGWSNGASTTLNTMHRQAQGLGGRAKFRAAVAFYPGCGPKALLARRLQLDAPVTMFLGSHDEEVSPTTCRDVAGRSIGAPTVQWYEGATHDFDDPGKSRQAVPANRAALEDVLRRAAAIFDAVP